tara:strand:+ start:116 stop:571 length:456 start_codon:yes stop_codon:yes gene_type:complete
MLIRPGRASDVDGLVELGRKHHAEGFTRLGYDGAKVEKLIMSHMTDANKFGRVAEKDGEIIGAIAGWMGEYPYSRDLVATDSWFFIDPTKRGGVAALRLMAEFKTWARERGAKEIYISVSSGYHLEKMDKLFNRVGFNCVGGVYQCWLEEV